MNSRELYSIKEARELLGGISGLLLSGEYLRNFLRS